MGSFKLRSCGAEMSHCRISCVLSRAPHILPAWKLLLCACSPKAADGHADTGAFPHRLLEASPRGFACRGGSEPGGCPGPAAPRPAGEALPRPAARHPALVLVSASSHSGSAHSVHQSQAGLGGGGLKAGGGFVLGVSLWSDTFITTQRSCRSCRRRGGELGAVCACQATRNPFQHHAGILLLLRSQPLPTQPVFWGKPSAGIKVFPLNAGADCPSRRHKSSLGKAQVVWGT